MDCECSVRVHKTPYGERDIRWYRKAFKGAKYVCVIRNPLAVLASKKYWSVSDSSYKWLTLDYANVDLDNITEALFVVKKSLITIKKLLVTLNASVKTIDKNANAEDASIVFYEDLVSNPKIEICRLLSSLNLEVSTSIVEDMMDVPSFSSYKNDEHRGIYKDSVDAWNHKLSPMEKTVILEDVRKFVKSYKFNSDHLRGRFYEYANL